MGGEVEPVDEADQPVAVGQVGGAESGQPVGGGRAEPARDRGPRRRDGVFHDRGADRFQRGGVATGAQPSQHRRDGVLGEQVHGAEGVVGLQVQLRAADLTHPGPMHRQLAAAEHDRAVLGPVPVGAAGRVVLALGPGQLGDLGGHQLAHHLQADSDRGGEQALPHPRGEQLQLVADLTGQPLDQLALLQPVQVDQPDPGQDRQAAPDHAGLIGLLRRTRVGR